MRERRKGDKRQGEGVRGGQTPKTCQNRHVFSVWRKRGRWSRCQTQKHTVEMAHFRVRRTGVEGRWDKGWTRKTRHFRRVFHVSWWWGVENFPNTKNTPIRGGDGGGGARRGRGMLVDTKKKKKMWADLVRPAHWFLCPFSLPWSILVCSIASVAFLMRHSLLVSCRCAAVAGAILGAISGPFHCSWGVVWPVLALTQWVSGGSRGEMVWGESGWWWW